METTPFRVICRRIGRSSKYGVSFEYNTQVIEKIKSLQIEDRKWDPNKKIWVVSGKGLFQLISYYKGSDMIFFDFGGEENRNTFIKILGVLKEKEDEKKKKEKNLEYEKKEWVEYKNYLEKNYKKYSKELNGLLKNGVTLFPHQITAALYMNKVKRALISHEMGTGKTLSAIVFVEMNPFEKVVVLTPNSLKFNFYNEINNFTNSKAHIVGWSKNVWKIEDAKYIILNYEYFNSGKKERSNEKWNDLNLKKIDTLICDEAQRLKNSKSNTYKNFKRIFSDKIFNGEPNKIFLSGTPAPNRAYELYNVLNQISPIEFKRKKDFYEYYCGMVFDYYNGWGYVFNTEGPKLEELYEKISPYTHRKRKKDVLNYLPEKTFQNVILEMDSNEERNYNEIEHDTANNIVPDIKSHHLSILMELRKYLSDLKMKHIINIVNDIIDTGEKVVIVDFFKKPLYDLNKKFKNISVIHTGDQSVDERRNAVNEFQDPDSPIKIFLGGLDVTKEGLTLTAASKMFLLTLPFVPGVYDQISDRLHRIGQKNAVNIYIPIFSNTIDELTLNMLTDKKRELSVVMDNEKYINEMKTDIMKNIFNHLLKKYDKGETI